MGQLNPNEWLPKQHRSIESFEILKKIAEGAFCDVYKAKDKETGEIVALKVIERISLTDCEAYSAIREIIILKRLDHKNVIHLKEIVTSPVDYEYTNRIYLVLEFMDHSLEGLLCCRKVQFAVPHIKCYMKQLLEGLCYCHANRVLHRDIKEGNILINNEGILKLADFGLSRWCPSDDSNEPNKDNTKLTFEVISLWYRPPELLLQTDEHCDYGPAIDMWSAGCVFAKLHRKRVMEGKDKADQMYKIWDLCGSANEFNWPGVSKLPKYDEFKPLKPMKRCVREVLSDLDPYALELLDRMLTLDPSKRISAKEALEEAYFSTDPPPSDPKSLPKYESSHGSWVLSGKDSSDGGPHPDHKVQGRGSCTSSPCTSQGHVLPTDASSTHDASPGAVGDSYGVNAQPAPR